MHGKNNSTEPMEYLEGRAYRMLLTDADWNANPVLRYWKLPDADFFSHILDLFRSAKVV
jgi:hypothetical protein